MANISSDKKLLHDVKFRKEFDVPFSEPFRLFHPFNVLGSMSRNDIEPLKKLLLSVRHADEVTIYACTNNLPYSIKSELVWLTKQGYSPTFHVKNSRLREVYNDCSKNISIDSSVNENIIVTLRNGEYRVFLILDEVYEINNRESILFMLGITKTKSNESIESLLKSSEQVYCLSPNPSSLPDSILTIFNSSINNSNFCFVTNVDNYDKKLYEEFRNRECNLVISKNITESLWIYKDGGLLLGIVVQGIICFVSPNRNDLRSFLTRDYFTPQYLKNNLLKHAILPCYILDKQSFMPYEIKPLKTFSRVIEANTIDDYLDDRYDDSFLSSYLECTHHQKVVFEIDFKAPRLVSGASPSKKYDNVVSIINTSHSIIEEKLTSISKELQLIDSITDKAFLISQFLHNISRFNPFLSATDGRFIEDSLFLKLDEIIKSTLDFEPRIVESFREIIAIPIRKASLVKIENVRDDIDNLSKKRDTLTQAIDANDNPKIKRQIASLEDEIADLEKIYNSAIIKANAIINDEVSSATELFKKNLYQQNNNVNDHLTVGRVVSLEDTQVNVINRALYTLAEAALFLRDTLEKCQHELSLISLPEAGILYETDKEVYLVINTLEVLKETKQEAIKFDAKIVTNPKEYSYEHT